MQWSPVSRSPFHVGSSNFEQQHIGLSLLKGQYLGNYNKKQEYFPLSVSLKGGFRPGQPDIDQEPGILANSMV